MKNKTIAMYLGRIFVLKTDLYTYHCYPVMFEDGTEGKDICRISRLDPASAINWIDKGIAPTCLHDPLSADL